MSAFKKHTLMVTAALAVLVIPAASFGAIMDDPTSSMQQPTTIQQPVTTQQNEYSPNPSFDSSRGNYAAVSPVTYSASNISYVTGGVGEEERNAIEPMKHNFNLHVVSAEKDGAYKGDTKLEIVDRKGNQVLSTMAGPLFYADLPPGNYTVNANSEGMQQVKNVKISDTGASNINFIWN